MSCNLAVRWKEYSPNGLEFNADLNYSANERVPPIYGHTQYYVKTSETFFELKNRGQKIHDKITSIIWTVNVLLSMMVECSFEVWATGEEARFIESAFDNIRLIAEPPDDDDLEEDAVSIPSGTERRWRGEDARFIIEHFCDALKIYDAQIAREEAAS